MDKSWTKIRNRLCKEFSDGVRSFISLAKEHVDERGFTRCPCKRCQNGIWKPLCDVESDLYNHGMSFTYNRWTLHGETPNLSVFSKHKEPVDCAGSTNVSTWKSERYKDHRAKLCRFYRKIPDPIESRQHPHKDVSVADWNLLCDKWETTNRKENSAKCKEGMSKIEYNHYAGTKSFMAHREEKKREDETYLSSIEIFHHTHWSAGKSWTSPVASELHQKMVTLQEKQAESSTPMTDEEIMASILGKRKSYVRGMRYEAKPPSKKRARYSQEYVQFLETQLATLKEELVMQNQRNERRFAQIEKTLARLVGANPSPNQD